MDKRKVNLDDVRLVADFMGLTRGSDNSGMNYHLPENLWYVDIEEYYSNEHNVEYGNMDDHSYCHLKDMKFNSDWYWVMLVVEKIEMIIESDDTFYNFNIVGGCNVYVITSNGDEIVSEDKGQSKLECVYDGCVSFIKWYNNQKNITKN